MSEDVYVFLANGCFAGGGERCGVVHNWGKPQICLWGGDSCIMHGAAWYSDGAEPERLKNVVSEEVDDKLPQINKLWATMWLES